MSSATRLTDLFRAVRALEPDPDLLPTMARMLGLGPPPAAPPTPGLVASVTEPVAPAGAGPRPRPGPVGAGPDPLVQPPSPDDPRPVLRPTVSVRHPGPSGPPRPPVPPVEVLLVRRRATRPADPRQLTLLPPASQRALLGALASGTRPGTEVDVDAAVDRLARRRPISPVPRRLERTTGLGVLLLSDGSPSMRPFAADVRRLVADLRLVVGASAVERTTIRVQEDGVTVRLPPRTPRRAGDGDPLDRALGSVPGRMVLVLTDLGAGPEPGAARSATPWTDLAARARRARCPLILLVPYPAPRRPAWSRAPEFMVLTWDRDVGVAGARQLADRATAHAGIRTSRPPGGRR